MIRRQRWILVGGLVLLAVVLFSFFANTVIDLWDRGETYQRQIEDNVDYAVTQAEVDLLNLVVALDAYAASGSTQDRESMQTRFDVLWSRLDVLLSGGTGEWIRLVPGGIETVEQVKQQLITSDESIFSGKGPIAAASLSRELLALRSRLHEIVIDFAHLRSIRVAEHRDDITSLMRRAAAYFIALVVISLVILALLGLALLSQWRAAEARDLALRQAREANQASEDSRERFRDSAESSSDWFWETDENHCVKFVTGKTERFVGGGFDDVIGKPRWEIYEADVENDGHWRGHRDDLEAHRPFRDFEFDYDHEDGTRSYRSISGIPVFDPSGDFQGYRGTSTDTTLRRQAELALRESEQRSRDFAETASDWLWETDEEGRFRYISRRYFDVTGVAPEDIIGKSRSEFMERRYTPQPSSENKNWTVHSKVFENRQAFRNLAIDFVRSDGERLSFLASGKPAFDEDGNFLGYRGTGTDITERKRAEEALSLTQFCVDHASDAVFWLGEDGGFEYVNEFGLGMLGYSRNELSKMYIWDVDPDVAQADWASTWARLASRGPHTFEAVHLTKQGSEVPVEVSTFHVDFGDRQIVCSFSRDITERKRAEAALRENEALYTTILDNMPAPAGLKAADGRYLFVNKVFAGRRGMSVDEIRGKTATDLWPKEIAEPLEAQDRELLRTGTPIDSETDSLGVDGVLRHYRGVKFPVFSEDGDIVAIGSVHTDITDRKRGEAQLELRDRQLSEAQRIGHIGHWTWDVASHHFSASDEYRRIYGFDSGIPLTIEAVTEAFHVDDREQMLRDREDAVREGKGYDFALRIRRRDEEMRYVEGRTEPILDEGGEVTGFFGITQDVTTSRLAKQESERLLSVIEHLSEGIALFDADDRLVVCNEPFRQLAGVGQHLLVSGVHYEEYLRGSVRLGAIPAAEADPEAWIADRLEHHLKPKGSLEVVREQRHILVNEERLPNGETAIIVFDITDQKQREEQLRQAQKMEAIGQLTGGVAHDFNNLLAIIQGNISFLDRSLEEDSELKALTAPALRATRRGASLTRRLLAFSRQQTLDVEPVDVGDLLRGLDDMLARSLGEDISLEIDAEADLWPCEADAGQLEQAVINLANNARDAMPEGGTLRFKASNLVLADADAAREADLPAGDYVVLAASDTGTGILPEVIDKIFDPFFTTKEIGKGSGLGLSMVYGFVEQLGGRVTARSEPGEGATFTLYLPRFDRGATVEAAPAAEPPSVATGETVLVVEDDIDLQTVPIRLSPTGTICMM